MKINLTLWGDALKEAEGDLRRIIVISETRIAVYGTIERAERARRILMRKRQRCINCGMKLITEGKP